MNNNLINDMLETIKPIFKATQAVIDSLADGKRMQIKDIVEAVGTSIGSESKKILAFVNHYLHNIEEAGIGYVTRGKKGGFVKGVRPAKVVKTPAINSAPLNSMIEELEETEETESDVEDIAV